MSGSAGGVFIALGSNLGNRELHLRTALRELAQARDIRIVRTSSFHETEPVGGPTGQAMFLNAVSELDTALPPRELLSRMLAIERAHGRVRTQPDGPRTLDLDLLLYRDVLIEDAECRVPHPRMWQREFVLAPLRELCDTECLAHFRSLADRAKSAANNTGMP